MNKKPLMPSSEIRERFLRFFEKRGHTIIPSASLVTSDEKGATDQTLFNTAGMQPLISYLLGKPYIDNNGKEVKRLVNVQKCLRTIDIDDIGDKTHATFFEMLGNWSLGDYFKKEAIEWSFQFLTSEEEGLGLDPKRLYVTVFEGDENAPKDTEAAEIWEKVFKIPRPSQARGTPFKKGDSVANANDLNGERSRIFFMPANSNWWETGDNGPCGPDTEMYYDVANRFGGREIAKEEFLDADSKREVVEIWNDVFMQYEKKDGKIVETLKKKSVDTGAGLERLSMVMQVVDNIYDTDLLEPVMRGIERISKNYNLKSARIVADHLRAAVFLIADGVIPSNTDRGYVLRKLIRRSARHADILGLSQGKVSTLSDLSMLVERFVGIYTPIYPYLAEQANIIFKEIEAEEKRFRETLKFGLKEFEKGTDAFTLFSSYGFPLELTLELAKEKGIRIDTTDFEEKLKKHQELSRSGAEPKFKGGLADANDPMIVRYHTATHLLHQALRDVLGDSITQKGSNITAERLRFDFSHGAKMTDEEKRRVEEIVNEKIAEKLPVNQIIMPRADAEKTGARRFFGEKYGNEISIYFVGKASNPPIAGDLENAYSKEFCGGPHVKNTHELAGPEEKWRFKIIKEEAVAQGIRRIKATLA